MNARFGMKTAACVLLGGALFAGSCPADTVILKNGTDIEGTVTEDNNNTVVIKQKNGTVRSFRKSDVDAVVYDRRVAPKVEAPASSAAEAKPPAKTDEKPADPKTGTGPAPATTEKKDDKETGAKTESKDPDADWKAPDGLTGFPDKAKRMTPEKEAAFKAGLEKLASDQETVRAEGKAAIAALGPDALPYVVTGINHSSVYARTACMNLIPGMGGKAAIKQVIEVFYSAMPDGGEAATYQVPFIREIKTTLSSITGQSYINVEPGSALVQDGLKKYIAWYNENIDTLEPQLGEKKIDKTDPEYVKKLADSRKLNLARKSWPRPAMPADMVSGPGATTSGRPAVPPGATERPADEAYRDSIKKTDRADALKRPQDK